MSKGDPKNKGKAFRDSLKKPFKQATFCRYSLSDEDKVSCKAWVFELDQVWDATLRLIDQSYKITYRFDDQSNAYACWLVSHEENEDNPNMILAGRGSSPQKAFKQACWQHFILFDGVWPKPDAPTSPEDFDD